MSTQENDKFQEFTFEALLKAAEVLTPDQLSCLCWHAGIASKDVLDVFEADMEPQHRTGYGEMMADKAEYGQER